MTYVRRAVEADVPALIALSRAFHAESPVHSQLPFSDGKVGQMLHSTIDNDDWLIAVPCDGEGEIVGLLALYCLDSFFSEAKEVGDLSFYVTPEARGTRAAPLLMKEALAWAKLKRAARIQLGITTGINHDVASKFFAAYGFVQTGSLMQRSIELSA